MEFTDQDIVEAIAALAERWPDDAFSAKQIGVFMGLRGTARLGRKASKGNWSGRMSPALKVAPSLRRMYRQGTLHSYEDLENCRWLYRLPQPWDRPYVAPVKTASPVYQRGAANTLRNR